jgi:hypothetical protein
VILIGSSVGSLTGIMMAKQRSDLFYAYVGTDQNAPDPQHLSYKLTVDVFRAAGHTKGIKLLEKMGPIRTKWIREDFVKKEQFIIEAIKDVPNMIMDLILPSMLSSPDHKIRDIIDIFKGMSFSSHQLFDEQLTFDFDKVGTH